MLFGTDEDVAERIALCAGPLTLVASGARVWNIRCGDREIWHGIAFLFRDADWGTPEPIVDDMESTISESAFLLRIVGHFATAPAIDFRLTIQGHSAGCVTFSGEAVPRVDVQASRLGLCVMHPMSACGARVEVEHADGRVSRSRFPTLIPPWPPFMLIRAIRHEYDPGCWARCTFAGDVFELEDQRNNSDASFKTYSRSNLMPRPYWLRAGVPIRQSVELRLETPDVRRPQANGSAIRVSVGSEICDLPKVGIEISAGESQAGAGVHGALRALRPAHLHLAVDARPGTIDWHGIKRLLATADAELRLDVSTDFEQAGEALADLSRALRDADLVPARIAVFPSEQQTLDAARSLFPASLVGGGTTHFFVQLNRIERLGAVDFLSFTTSPIVHGADDESVMLTLQSLPSMIDTLGARYPAARFAIGPSTLAARRSPLGNQPETDGSHRVALAQQDPRCRGLYGAAWVLGYVAQFAREKVDALTLFSLSGPSGVLLESENKGVRAHPAFFVLERLRGPARVHAVTVSDVKHVAVLALHRDRGSELLLANLTGDTIDVEIDGWTASSSCAILDADACQKIASDVFVWNPARRSLAGSRLRLDAYAVASLAG